MPLINNHLKRSLFIPLLLMISLWFIKIAEILFQQTWAHWGIYPRTWIGLRGILFSPLLHGSLQHLISNSVPLFVLSTSLFYFYKKIAWKVFLFSYIFVGLWVWLLGRENYHIGASGLIYAFWGFLVFSGILRKQRALLAISLIVVFLYGSIVWGIFPQALHISWESHLFGFFVGLILAYYYKDVELPSFINNTTIETEQDYTNDFWNDVIEKD